MTVGVNSQGYALGLDDTLKQCQVAPGILSFTEQCIRCGPRSIVYSQE